MNTNSNFKGGTNNGGRSEKHFTLDKNCQEGTDHILSATPDELTKMVETIHRIEVMLGDDVKQPSSGENKIIDFVRTRFPN